MRLSFHSTDHFTVTPALIVARPECECCGDCPAWVIAFEFLLWAVVLDIGHPNPQS